MVQIAAPLSLYKPVLVLASFAKLPGSGWMNSGEDEELLGDIAAASRKLKQQQQPTHLQRSA